MEVIGKDGFMWTIWYGGDIPPVTGPVEVITADETIIRVSRASFLHWENYSISQHSIVAYRATSETANASDLPCAREKQFDEDSDRAD